MTQTEFDQFTSVLNSLFPKLETNREQLNVWRMAVNMFDVDRAISALRDWAAFKSKWPRPADIRQAIAANTPRNVVDNREAEARRREEIEQDIRQRDQTIAEMSDDVVQRHLSAAVAHDWRLERFAKAVKSVADVRKSPGLKSVIALRVWAGIGPDDPGRDEVPPRGVARGNVGAAVAREVAL